VTIDFTHDPRARSWVPSANEAGADFPLQNLPLCVFRRAAVNEPWRGGVGIGRYVLDLAQLMDAGLLGGLAQQALGAAARPVLNELMALGRPAWRALRHGLFRLLRDDTPDELRARLSACLVPQQGAEWSLPARVGDYTDFYTSLHHALNIGRLRRPDNPLSPNFHWMPIAYHGRASSLVVSGTPVRRPLGQRLPVGADAPVFGPCTKLDYELELGLWVGPGNQQGEPIAQADAQAHLFGVSLLNDWSARDHQFWESQPLGPFLGKNFATTVSPWIVTMEALAPYRCPWTREASFPQPLAHLDAADVRERGAIDIQLKVSIASAAAASRGSAVHEVSRTSFRHQHWTFAQMLAHHTTNGCNLAPGDLLGSGTISGPQPEEAGALIERSFDGRKPLIIGPDETRSFLLDGDTVIFQGWCDSPQAVRIGFGECLGMVLPSVAA
jgi:fumarylacetoacetase